MGIPDRNYDNRLPFGRKVNPLIILVGISMLAFVALAFCRALTYLRFAEGTDITAYFDKNIISLFALSPNWHDAFSKIWTFITYAFVYVNVWQLFANMLWLWCFGYILIDLTGNRKIIPLFLYGSVFSGLSYILAYKLFPGYLQQNVLHFYGAYASIMSIAMAATTISPTYKLFPILGGGISLWIITLLYAIINLSTIASNNPALYITQLTAAGTGYFFILILRKGFDGSEWMNFIYDWFINLFNPDKPKEKFRSSFFYKTTTTTPYSKTTFLTQKKLDDILDKMNQAGGYDHLTQAEKDVLKRASQEDFRKN